MEFASMKEKKIEEFIDLAIGPRVALLLDETARNNVPPDEIAMPMALRRFEEMRLKATHPTTMAKIFGFALDLYRRGFIPGSIVGTLAPRYFKRILG